MPRAENSVQQSTIAASAQVPEEKVAAGASLDGRYCCQPSEYTFSLPGRVTLAVQTLIKGLKRYPAGQEGAEQKRD